MTEVPDTQPSPSGDHSPFLVRVAERLSRRPDSVNNGLSIEKALWAMVLVQMAQMDTENLSWVLSLLL